MYISNLNLFGFKSFANKEKLKFSEGITAIVGPNGCGKTNIVDAVRWVLGEQKYSLLRGSKMEDVIFNGSSVKKPLNVCEVSLTVNNDKGKLPIEYTDVEITRRIFRNGESDYMINRNSCRLKDIHNLFIDTGMGADAYSVIELKMVEQILSETADDRRRMFEEAAGINKYKNLRKTTFRKFEAIRSDLDRVDDIIVEVEKKVHALRLQLKRYNRHATLIKNLKNYEVELAYIKVLEHQSKLEPTHEKITSMNLQRKTYEDEEKGLENALTEHQKIYQEQQKDLSGLEEELNDLLSKRQEVNDRILVLTEQKRSAKQTVSRLKFEKEEDSKRIESNKFQIEELKTNLESLEPKISDKSKEYRFKKSSFNEVDSAFSKSEDHLEHLNNLRLDHLQKINSTNSHLDRTEELLKEKSDRLKTLEKRIVELENNRGDTEKSQNELEGRRKLLQKAISSDRKVLNAVDEDIRGLRTEKHKLSLDFHRIASQVEALESQLQFYKEIIENREGYPSGVRYVLKNLKKYRDVIGTVADIIQVDESLRPAIEVAIGDISCYLVCKTRNSAVKILKKVMHEKVGKVSIIPLDSEVYKTKKKLSLPKVDGVIGVASELVSYKKNVEHLVNYLLNDVLIVKDEKVAEEVWNTKEFRGHIADLSGRFYDQNGSITSINGEQEIGVLGRKDKIVSLDKQIDSLIKESAKNQDKAKNIDLLLEEKENQQKQLSLEMKKQIDSLAEIEKNITRNEFSISQNIESLQTITHENVTIRQDILNLERSIDKLTPELKNLQEQEEIYREKIDRAKKTLDDTKEKREQINNIIQDLRVDLIGHENERDNLQYKIEGLNGNIEEYEQRIVDLSDEIDDIQAQSDQMIQEIVFSERELKKLNAEIRHKSSVKKLKEETFSDTYEQIDELQSKIKLVHHESEQLTDDLKKFELDAADRKRQIDLIKHRLEEKYEMEIPRSFNVTMSADELTLQIDRIERSIERIGPINMAVKDEYEEESNRLEFLEKQRKDLIKSEESLLQTIRKIDSEARRRFTDTYNQIRKNFQKTFKLFFEGGEGDLQLTGDEDPLEADISISARPPGKRTQHLRSLSAGEKALTSIALLFSIYQVKPSPFCILDEVDAPLDDNNIAKFTRIVEKFSEDTQFIIVTHNKLTMESAKYLYGVTMEQTGISKIVSVQMN